MVFPEVAETASFGSERFLADIRVAMATNNNHRLKLSQFAKSQGITYATAHRHWQQGLLDGVQLETGTILVSGYKSKEAEPADKEREIAVTYARVSSPNQSSALKAQSARLANFANERGYQVVEAVEEYGSGFSDRRTKLLSLLHRQDWDVLIVEAPGSLLKFGLPYLQVMLSQVGKSVVFIEDDPEYATNPEEAFPDHEQELNVLMRKTQEFVKTLVGHGQLKQIVGQSVRHLAS